MKVWRFEYDMRNPKGKQKVSSWNLTSNLQVYIIHITPLSIHACTHKQTRTYIYIYMHLCHYTFITSFLCLLHHQRMQERLSYSNFMFVCGFFIILLLEFSFYSSNWHDFTVQHRLTLNYEQFLGIQILYPKPGLSTVFKSLQWFCSDVLIYMFILTDHFFPTWRLSYRFIHWQNVEIGSKRLRELLLICFS